MNGTDDHADGLAPAWHTALLVFVMVAVAVTGAVLSTRGGTAVPNGAARGSRVATEYVPILIVQWALLAYVCRVGRQRNAFGRLVAAGRVTPARLGVDVAVAILGFVVVEATEWTSATFFGGSASPAVLRLLPSTALEHAVWVLVAVSVGICEEVVYRGYLQTQFTAFTRSAALGVAAQAVLFGVAHGEQGVTPAIRMALYGAGLGWVASWRRSLFAGIFCHVALDLLSGFVVR